MTPAKKAAASPAGAAPAPKVPPGTDAFLWKVAASWADVPLAELLADTAPVKSAHYAAALRVDKTFDEWLARHDEKVAARARTAAGDLPASDIKDDDPFARAMLLAEDMAALTASARDRGDAVRAVKYSSFEQALLQVAAGLQIGNDIEMGK